MSSAVSAYQRLFNGAVEVGLRMVVLLTDLAPSKATFNRLVMLDYFIVHTDDLPNGPKGIHPKTPHRGGELLVRRSALSEGLQLYSSRGLVEISYNSQGILYSAGDMSCGFLDSIDSEYVRELRLRSRWLHLTYGDYLDSDLESLVRSNIGIWGAEFEFESVLYSRDSQ